MEYRAYPLCLILNTTIMKVTAIQTMITVDQESGEEQEKIYISTEDNDTLLPLLHKKKVDGTRMNHTEMIEFLKERKDSWQETVQLVEGEFGMYYTCSAAKKGTTITGLL